MADFEFGIEGPSGSAVGVQSPIRRPTLELGGVGRSLANMGTIKVEETKDRLKSEADAAKAQREMDNAEAIAEFSNKQLAITQAVETGAIRSSVEARSRMRENLTSYTANYPELAVDLAKAHTAYTKTSGLGNATYEGTAEEKQSAALIKSAIDDGWALPGQTPEEQMQGALAHSQFKRAQEMVGAQQKAIALKSATIGLTTAQINQQTAKFNLLEKQQKQASQVAVGQMTSAYNVKVNQQLSTILKRSESGEIGPQQATMEMDQALFELDTFIAQEGSGASGEYIANMTSPIRQQVANYKRYVSGEITKTALENKNGTLLAIQTNNALGVPEIARLAAASAMFPNSSMATAAQSNQMVMEFLDQNSGIDNQPVNVMPSYESDKTGIGTYLNVVKDNMSAMSQGTVDDPVAVGVEISTNLTKVLDGVNVFGPTTTKPAEFNNVIKFLADPVVGKYIKKHPEALNGASAAKATQAIQAYYADKALPAIKAEFDRVSVLEMRAIGGPSYTTVGPSSTEGTAVVSNKPIGTAIKPVFTGAGVTFMSTDPKAPVSVKRAAEELNKKLSPIINNMTYMTSHLSGNVDYKSTYEQYFAPLFEGKGEE